MRRCAATWRLGLMACVAALAMHALNAVAASGHDKIIISGASGQLGGLTVKALLARGVPADDLILVSRTPDKLSGYAKLGASVRFGDFNQPASLPAAYAGGTRMLLISITPGPTPRPELHKIAIDAAVKAGVTRIVYTSYVNLEHNSSPLAADHRRSEQYLKESGVKWTMLRNGIYADRVLQLAMSMMMTGRATVPDNDIKIAYVTREDCAAAAAGALTTSGHDDKAYDITGPDLVGIEDMALLASNVTGKHIEIVRQPAGAPVPGPGPMGGAALSIKSDAVKELSGKPATSMRALLQANKDKLLAAAEPH